MAMLEVKNLSVNYGVIEAVKDVSFEVNEGEVVTLSALMVLVKPLSFVLFQDLFVHQLERFLSLEMRFKKFLLVKSWRTVYHKFQKVDMSLQA